MTVLTRHDCLNHPLREAVARCAACRSFFCRECISEHEGRMICAPCLGANNPPVTSGEKSRLLECAGWLGALFCLLGLWMVFYSLGRLLASLPSSFHDNLLR